MKEREEEEEEKKKKKKKGDAWRRSRGQRWGGDAEGTRRWAGKRGEGGENNCCKSW